MGPRAGSTQVQWGEEQGIRPSFGRMAPRRSRALGADGDGSPWFARVGPEKLNRLRPDRFSGPLCVFDPGHVIDTLAVRA